jgi:integrase
MVPELAIALDRLSTRERFTGPDDFVFASDQGEPLDVSARAPLRGRAEERRGCGRCAFTISGTRSAPSQANAALNGRELQEWMGHADYRTTARYLHYRSRGDEARRLAGAFTPQSDLQPDCNQDGFAEVLQAAAA